MDKRCTSILSLVKDTVVKCSSGITCAKKRGVVSGKTVLITPKEIRADLYRSLILVTMCPEHRFELHLSPFTNATIPLNFYSNKIKKVATQGTSKHINGNIR